MREDRPSETALLIALATVLLAADPRRRSLVPPGAAELSRRFLETSARGRMFAAGVSNPLGRWL